MRRSRWGTRGQGLVYLIAIYCFTLTSEVFAQSKSRRDLIDVLSVNPSIVLDIRYATENNFTHHKLYSIARCMLRREAAESLSAVQQELHGLGLGLKVFDGYRPLSVQKKLWEAVPDERYVANPEKGSRHNRGAAVDLTIIDSLGNELAMPTPYDDFTTTAHADYMNLPEQVMKNRAILENVMTKHGFLIMSSEWWHFDFHGWGKFDVLDIPLE